MKFSFLIVAVILSVLAGCSGRSMPVEHTSVPQAYEPKNSVYYWKTVFQLDSADMEFIGAHDIRRIYLRMFDVSEDPITTSADARVYPNASVQVDDMLSYMFRDSVLGIEITPVVYITLDALKAIKDREGALAEKITTRVRNMCEYNFLPGVEELQLDCDWTPGTEDSFFRLCDSVKTQLRAMELPWRLSSTIRLHQLARKAPPVDHGVLMVYNTGNFSNPDAANSILAAEDVAPYLKRLPYYPLELDVAYPTYSWQLLFRQRQFVGLLNGLDLSDSTRFAPCGVNQYKALGDMPHNKRMIHAGDVVRSEISDFADISLVKSMIDARLSGRPHSNIIYHLDSKNLSQYSADEISFILLPSR